VRDIQHCGIGITRRLTEVALRGNRGCFQSAPMSASASFRVLRFPVEIPRARQNGLQAFTGSTGASTGTDFLRSGNTLRPALFFPGGAVLRTGVLTYLPN
jgi:hypothetical protein